jgi:hypothetical protein
MGRDWEGQVGQVRRGNRQDARQRAGGAEAVQALIQDEGCRLNCGSLVHPY